MITHTGAGRLRMRRRIRANGIARRQNAAIRAFAPPFPAIVGLYGSPTVINNVETLCSAPEILSAAVENGMRPWIAQECGTRLFCISGHVNKPGIYELPMASRCVR